MTEKQKLNQKLWDIANNLRGKMGADEFRDYILGFIFYKYLSEKMLRYANKWTEPEGYKYNELNQNTKEGQDILDEVKKMAIEDLGYFLEPGELFSTMVMRGNGNGKAKFILDDLQKVLIDIEQSTMGTDSEEDFENLFEELDLDSSKLGKTPEDRNEIIVKVMEKLDEVDFQLDNPENDVLGDAYEYLIGQFASGAGKKAGEFYTPQEVSSVLAKLVTVGKERLKSVYDPTCGSGSLLLRVAREVDEIGEYFGQESNPTTYNLCRMNMIMHDVHYSRFDIKNEDTLERPQHIDKKFEAVVANPPFSANWSSDPLKMNDDRFSTYGKLAPKSRADFAFVQHMIHQLDDNGTMACVLPHGVLFRKGGEGTIRNHLLSELNCIDAVIGLPGNLFFGTDILTCIIVIKKNRKHTDKLLFINASEYYENVSTKNRLRDSDIKKIYDTYLTYLDTDTQCGILEEKYSYISSIDEIRQNKYNLNINRYVDTFEEEELIDLDKVTKKLNKKESQIRLVDDKISMFCERLNIPTPCGQNVPALRLYKKGIMQRIFSQELRFKNSEKPYPNWDYVNFNRVFERVTRKNSEDNKNVLTISAQDGLINQEEYFNKSVASKNLKGYYLLKKGEFAYNKSYSNGYPMGAIKRLKRYDKGVVSTLYICFRIKNNDTPEFYEEYFESSGIDREIHKIAQEGARNHGLLNMSISEFFEDIEIPRPSLEEQETIATFLNLITRKIALLSR